MKPSLLTVLHNFTIIFSLFNGFLYFNKINKQSKIIILFLSFSFFAEFMMYLLIHYNISTYLLINIFAIIQYLTFILFFYTLLKFNKYISIFLICIPLFLGLKNVAEYTIKLDAQLFSILSLIIILFSVSSLLNLIKNPKNISILEEPDFWSTTGLLFYFSVNIFNFSFIEFIVKDLVFNFWVFHNISFIVMLIFFNISFWKSLKHNTLKNT